MDGVSCSKLCPSPSAGEALAIKEALRLAVFKQWRRIVVEGHFANVITAINDVRSPIEWEFEALILDIMALMSFFVSCSISFIRLPKPVAFFLVLPFVLLILPLNCIIFWSQDALRLA